ncbi:hypothetical protein E3N88_11806 [Mikania micrantha]|uniref:Uncharacterized protein n=1 Tax=Mikania micrantha TaxID=192012 RepID=A0A5N6P530_9ASTR|nr:hypothetical protein E3N88_11806 [Mikania micrantha]
MEFQHFLSKSPDAHCHAKSCTGSAGPCTTVQPGSARPCMQCWPMNDRAPSCMTVQLSSARPCMVVLAYARPCISLARPCKIASAGPNGVSAGHHDLRTTVLDTSSVGLPGAKIPSDQIS